MKFKGRDIRLLSDDCISYNHAECKGTHILPESRELIACQCHCHIALRDDELEIYKLWNKIDEGDNHTDG